MPFRNQVVAGTALVRDAIHSPGYQTGVTGWSINKDGSAEFNDVDIRGGLTVTQDAMSANYVAGVSGWHLGADGTAEFNGNVDMLSGTVTGAFQSSNYVSGTSGWRLNANGTAEFNGAMAASLSDGKIATGANVDTANNVLNTIVAVGSGNPQNTPQVSGHGYMALVQVDAHTDAGPTRLRYSLWNGAVGGTQLGAITPIAPLSTATAGAANGRFETHLLMFVWKATTTTAIANINLGYEQLVPGGAANPTFTRVGTSAFAFIIWDLGLASRITNL